MQGNADCCRKLSLRNDTVLHIAADTNVHQEQAQVLGEHANGATEEKKQVEMAVPPNAVRNIAITRMQDVWARKEQA